MRTSKQGTDLVKRFESLSLTAYTCPAGKLTIGYGSTAGVRPGMRITRAEADARLAEDLLDAERAVDDAVLAPLTQPQFDALTSLVFNIGAGAFATSTLVKKLNQGKYHEAAAQFDRWVHAGKKKLPGLVRRRAAEKLLFLSGTTRPELKPLAKSRTVIGGGVAGAATVASEVVNEVKDQVEPLAPYADPLRWLFLAAALIGIGVTVWARVSDRRKGIR